MGQLLDALANVVGFVMKIFGNPVVSFFFNIISKTAISSKKAFLGKGCTIFHNVIINSNVKIALFHGPIDTSITDIGYVISSRHFKPEIFNSIDT